MAVVVITDVTVLDNPASFTSPFSFQITFQCLQELPQDIEWKVTYVGSASDESLDQTLEEVLVGPLVVATSTFVLQTNCINHSLIPNSELVGVTVVLVTCSYMEREFVRIGYYLKNEYQIEYDPENVPLFDVSKVTRTILADEPRVTYFAIDWGVGGYTEEPQVEGTDGEVVDEAIEVEDEGDAGEGEDDEDEEDDEEDEDEDEDDSTGDMEIDINEDSMDVEGMQTAQLTRSDASVSNH